MMLRKDDDEEEKLFTHRKYFAYKEWKMFISKETISYTTHRHTKEKWNTEGRRERKNPWRKKVV